MLTVDDLARKMGREVKPWGGFWARCPCPTHDGKPSKAKLIVKPRDKGTVVVCTSGCALHLICQAIGIQVSDLFRDWVERENALPDAAP